MAPLMKAAAMSILASMLLTGCWDIKDPQDVNYLSAIGLDYVDNQYIAYAQMLDFSTVAKLESGKAQQHAPVWVGKGIGETVDTAINSLYDTAQLRVFYGHINAIIYSENVLKKGLEPIFDLLNRYYEFRYTPWVFGTDLPIDKIMTVSPFFNLSPMSSVMHQPMESYKQQSKILPLTSREFISNYREPGKTALLPSLGIKDDVWKQDLKNHPMLDLVGVYAFHGGSYSVPIKEDKIIGLRWVQPETLRASLIVRSAEKPHATIWLGHPNVKITPEVKADRLSYDVEVRITGSIVDVMHPLPEQTLEQYAAEQIRAEIQQTYKEGLRNHVDLLQLEHALYRKNNKLWKTMRDRNQLKLTSDILDIHVHVHLDNSGKLKLNG